jgi:uncharacterized membrane protein
MKQISKQNLKKVIKVTPRSIRAYILAGLLLWLPILVTIGVLRFIVDLLDQSVALLPHQYQPLQLLGMSIPGLGVILSLTILITTGILVTNFLGQKLLYWWELILGRIPLVRTIHMTVKQILQSLFSANSKAFRQVVLVEYPSKSIWTIGFLTGDATLIEEQAPTPDLVSVFVPNTPIPTAGFIIMVRADAIVPLSISVEEALKYIISLGVMTTKPSQPIEQMNKKKGLA